MHWIDVTSVDLTETKAALVNVKIDWWQPPTDKKKGTENQYCFLNIDLQSTGLQRVEKSSLFKIKSVHFRAIGQKYNSGITN